MGRRTVSTTHKAIYGVTLSEILIVLVIIGIVAAILFPVFQKGRGDYRPTGRVLNGFGKPLPGATLRFRDASGRLVATITADGQGEFRRTGLRDLSRNTIIGFALTRFLHRTGGSDVFTFTPLGTQTITFTNEFGKPIPGLAVTLHLDNSSWVSYFESGASNQLNNKLRQITDKNGNAQVTQVPTDARFKFEIPDRRRTVEGVQTVVYGNTVKYVVTVTSPTASRSPRLTDAAQAR